MQADDFSEIGFDAGVSVQLPSLDDLIRTKRFGARPRDLDDIRLLEMLKRRLP